MRLIKCRKCGTTISTKETFVEQMILTMNELNKKALTCKRSDKNIYIQQAAQVKKMITMVQHLSSQIEERSTTVLSELSEIVHYLKDNNLISVEKLDELRQIAREKAKIKNRQDEAEINKIYGEFENVFVNRTKSDKTAKEAIRKLKGGAG